MEYLVGQAIHCIKQSDFSPQSGSTADNTIRLNSGQWQQETTTFGEEPSGYNYAVDSFIDSTRRLQDVNDATFAEFFSRPVRIASYNWGTGTSLSEDLNPWEEYFSHPRIVNRVANFNLLRAKLNIKIVLNGNGFHYGRLIAGYLPLDTYDQASSFAGLVPQDNVQLSQCPHVFLNPTTSTGGSMELPFFYHKNYLSVPNAEWRDMGRLFLRTLNTLKHANNASDQVTVTVFAWASDVELAMPTARNPIGMVPQSGKEIDEANLKGIVSGPASTVAAVAGALANVPAIAPFAMATSTVAGAVASAAKSLGYSRPPVTKNPDPYRPTPTSLLAATVVPDTAQKLTLDDKQELTIDPRIAGIGPNDPMSIVDIAKRESYLNTFDWDIGTATNTTLYNYGVTPMHWAISGAGTDSEAVHLPACAMAALPFNYWTGSINFRFQIVCSAHHKGKLEFAFEPTGLGFGGDTTFVTNYTKVVDIAEENDFTVTIGMAQVNNIIPCKFTPGGDDLSRVRGASAVTSDTGLNGVLTIKVLNELTTPNSTEANNISINCFVSAGDDFEVFAPNSQPASYTFKPSTLTEFDTQSGLDAGDMPGDVVSDELDKPQQEQTDQFAGDMQDGALLNKVFMGESIRSFRQLIKRYNFHRRELIPKNGQRGWLTRPMFPIYRGKVANAVDDSSIGKYNYCNTTILHWVTMAFSGWRGGVRWKMLLPNSIVDDTIEGQSVVKPAGYVTRVPINTFVRWETDFDSRPNYTSATQCAYDAVYDLGEDLSGKSAPTMMNGGTYFDGAINPNVEVEIPYYNNLRFKPGKTVNYTTINLNIEHFRIVFDTTSDGNSVMDFHCAAAEDFQVYFFTGMPRLYLEAVPPIPS